MAIGLDSEFDFGIDINRVIKMLVLHEIGEVLIGDITPFDNITAEEKYKREHEAISEIVGDLVKKDELIDLLIEFDAHETINSKFAYLCDKLEADIQAKVYQDMGLQRSLSDQENNIVFRSEKIQEMIHNGALTPFDLWYLWDKDKFEENEVFSKMLSYIKDNSTII